MSQELPKNNLEQLKELVEQRELPINSNRLEHVWSRFEEMGIPTQILEAFVQSITYISFEQFKQSLNQIFAAIDEHVGDNEDFIVLTYDSAPNSSGGMLSRLLQLKYKSRVKAVVDSSEGDNNSYSPNPDYPFKKGNYKNEKVIIIDDWSFAGEHSQFSMILDDILGHGHDPENLSQLSLPVHEDVLITLIGMSERAEQFLKSTGIRYFCPNTPVKGSSEALTGIDTSSLNRFPEEFRGYLLGTHEKDFNLISWNKIPDNVPIALRRELEEHEDAYPPLEDLWILNNTPRSDIQPAVYPFYKTQDNYDDILLSLLEE